jgi:prepilin-type N-terminal cleavage/methylation domain-containing protein
MTSAVRTTKQPRGFTLLEIVMVLGIAAMVMGGSVGLMIYSSDERTLRDASTQIEMLAKRARTISILQQTPYALEFRTGIVRLLPLARAGADEKTAAAERRMMDDDDEARALEDDRQVVLAPGMDISIRRWNSDKWFPTGKNTVHVWRFDPDGLCEPVSIRLNLDKSWSEDAYHPLTATIRESQLEAR